MWRKDKGSLREWTRTFWPIRIIRIRLAAWPSRYSMLQVIEDLDIYLICRAIFGYDVAHTMFHVIMVGKFKHRLAQFLTQPDYRFTDELVVPLHAVEDPWCLQAC